MNKISTVQTNVDIAQELAAKNYETIIGHADETQRELIRNWRARDSAALEQLILASRHILNYWVDAINKKRSWMALVRCGAWIGTLETIEKSIYEESMDAWSRERFNKSISSIKHLTEIVGLLEVRGVMSHSEIVEELNLNHASTLTEIMKKIASFELINMRKTGKYRLYSLTDAGVRFAKQMRAGEDKQMLLKNVIQKYGLRMNEITLDSYLRSADEKMPIKTDQTLKVKIDNEQFLTGKVDRVYSQISYEDEEEEEVGCLVLSTTKEKAIGGMSI